MTPRIDHVELTVRDLDRADSPAEVDQLCGAVRAIPGARIRIPPRLYPDYAPDYYAFFFYDTEGIELEIVSFDRTACFAR